MCKKATRKHITVKRNVECVIAFCSMYEKTFVYRSGGEENRAEIGRK
jgi:hypothetical protein